jgi:hypothetical protein
MLVQHVLVTGPPTALSYLESWHSMIELHISGFCFYQRAILEFIAEDYLRTVLLVPSV